MSPFPGCPLFRVLFRAPFSGPFPGDVPFSGPFVFVSSDRDLNAAALAEGLTVEDPNFHP